MIVVPVRCQAYLAYNYDQSSFLTRTLKSDFSLLSKCFQWHKNGWALV